MIPRSRRPRTAAAAIFRGEVVVGSLAAGDPFGHALAVADVADPLELPLVAQAVALQRELQP
jgi:hypothetical protein